MDLQRIKALNEFWQKAFDRKHPKQARLRRIKDGEISDKPRPILVNGRRHRPVSRPSGGL